MSSSKFVNLYLDLLLKRTRNRKGFMYVGEQKDKYKSFPDDMVSDYQGADGVHLGHFSAYHGVPTFSGVPANLKMSDLSSPLLSLSVRLHSKRKQSPKPCWSPLRDRGSGPERQIVHVLLSVASTNTSIGVILNDFFSRIWLTISRFLLRK